MGKVRNTIQGKYQIKVVNQLKGVVIKRAIELIKKYFRTKFALSGIGQS